MAKDTPTFRDAQEAYEAGDIETALAIADGLIGEDETKADPEVLWLAGECLLEMQEAHEALHLFDAALKQDEHNPLLRHCRGLCLFELGRAAEAKALFLAVVEATDELAEPLFYLGLLAEREGDEAAARDYFAKAADRDPENFVVPADWSDEDVKAAFDAMVEECPEPLSLWLATLNVEVEARPSDAMLQRGDEPISPLVLCLFEGEPGSGPEGDDPEGWLNARPERVVLYRSNLGKSAQDEYELAQEVFEAVLTETCEFLQLDDGQLETLGVVEFEEGPDDEDVH